MNTLKAKFKQNPAVILLLFVYLWIIPHCLSYQNAWVQPEEWHIKLCVLSTGPTLNLKDLGNGLNWQGFEYKPRLTRPLSSYFEIIDTKFRTWLWHYICPHPSLSLTWVFSLILAPLYLYKLLKNLGIHSNLAIAMISYYLATPEILSYEAMLFRPAKPMTNFFIIFCLYLASVLKKRFLDKNTQIPLLNFLFFLSLSAISFFWDETALLIFPAILFLFPSIFRQKVNLCLWLILPFLTIVSYLVFLPALSHLAGFNWPHLMKYDLVQLINQPVTIQNFFQHFWVNSKNLMLNTMGIFPVSKATPKIILLFLILDVLSWGVIFCYILKSIIKFDLPGSFLIFLLFIFNLMISLTNLIWGPYYYGTFWPIFFIIYISKHIHQTGLNKFTYAICFLFIIISSSNCFLGINTIYKKHHLYPFNPHIIKDYFEGKRLYFNGQDEAVFSGSLTKSYTEEYWNMVRAGQKIDSLSLPIESGFLPIELEPTRTFYKSLPGAIVKYQFDVNFPNADEILEWLIQNNYILKYSATDYFLNTKTDNLLRNKIQKRFPQDGSRIFSILEKSNTPDSNFLNLTSKPYDQSNVKQ